MTACRIFVGDDSARIPSCDYFIGKSYCTLSLVGYYREIVVVFVYAH